MMTIRKFPLSALAAGLAAAVVGCSADMAAEPLPPDDGIQPAEDTVTVRFRNLAVAEAVDVEFYATNEPLENLPDSLFVAENLVTANIEVAGTGIVQPSRQDTIELPCASSLTVGTRGGSFLENESGEPRGTGVARWAQEAPLGLCGSVVTFEFSGSEGEFTTTLTIDH